jgi:urease accessory protein
MIDGGRETGRLLALLQFSDGLFPAGGFAHSFGLETYVQSGHVRDGPTLQTFLVAHLEGMAGPCDAAAAVRAAETSALPQWMEIDARLEAMKCVPEFRDASGQMGRQTLRAAAALGPDPALGDLDTAIEAGATPGHHAMVFGAVVGRAGIHREVVATAYLYSSTALLVNAALRLLPLGQVEGQRILAGMRPRIVRLAARAAVATLDDLWSFAPGLERAGLVHAGLEARLFRS